MRPRLVAVAVADCGYASPCWMWTGFVNRVTGYAQTHRPKREGWRTVAAHRAIWEAARGPIPDGLTVDHLCRVRVCVNPEHLEVVTQGENTRRGTGPVAVNARKVHCARGHPLHGSNLYVDGDGARVCRTCHAARERMRRARQRERTA